ncbi:hypothetical protein SD77_1749 [Bacillus badius]|uniref:Uncharacterized protein n=1 Tax=Bacillus badius TaxID=1455 RepID=A0ABR5AR41_BACBA|nr:hypothetical protein SD78_4229 [Bacillus badius]KIL77144.1 hypothetical protein SD77_1749 [Bacillus badius]
MWQAFFYCTALLKNIVGLSIGFTAGGHFPWKSPLLPF